VLAYELKPKPEPRMKTIAELECEAIAFAVARYSATRAAKELGIDRSTLQRKMRRYGLSKHGATVYAK
jgi:transcriptional regulator of acetoin/glycerol metabolism